MKRILTVGLMMNGLLAALLLAPLTALHAAETTAAQQIDRVSGVTSRHTIRLNWNA